MTSIECCQTKNGGQTWFQSIRSSKTVVFWVVAILVTIDSIFYSIIIPILPFYMESENLSEAWAGILFSTFPLAFLVASPVGAYCVDRFGKKPILIGGLVVLIFSTILYALVTSFWLLIIGRILQGASSASTWVGGMALVSAYFPHNEQGGVYGKLMSGVGIGVFAGPLIGGVLFEWTGRQDTPFIVSSVFLLFSLIALIIIKDQNSEEEKDTSTTISYKSLAKDRTIVVLVLCYLWAQFLSAGEEPVLPLYFVAIWDLSSGWIGALFGLLLFAFTAGSLAVGKIVDKFPSKRFHCVSVGMWILTISAPATVFCTNIWLECAVLVVLGIGSACVAVPQLPLLNVWIEQRYNFKKDTLVTTILNMAYSIGAVGGPVLLSTLLDLFGFRWTMSSVSGVTLVLASLSTIETYLNSTSEMSDYAIVTTVVESVEQDEVEIELLIPAMP